MAVQLDYLQALIDRGDVYTPSDVALLPPTPVALALPRPRQRVVGLDTLRVVAMLGAVAWSIVAVETWMLVR